MGCNRNNELILTFGNGIQKNDVRIELEVMGYVRKTTIYRLGQQETVPNGYGENDWTVTYKDSLAGHFRHIKTNRNDYHKYDFKFYQRDTSIFVDVSIKGIGEFYETIKLTVKE